MASEPGGYGPPSSGTPSPAGHAPSPILSSARSSAPPSAHSTSPRPVAVPPAPPEAPPGPPRPTTSSPWPQGCHGDDHRVPLPLPTRNAWLSASPTSRSSPPFRLPPGSNPRATSATPSTSECATPDHSPCDRGSPTARTQIAPYFVSRS